MLSVTCKPFMLNVAMLNVIMLNVVMLSVVMLSVVSPLTRVEVSRNTKLTFVERSKHFTILINA
jgi:hypothetical protein